MQSFEIIGGKKLKDLFATIGTPPKYNNGSTYYSNENIQRVRELLSQRQEKEVIDMSKYISNKDLMEMFSFNSHKAWYVATTEKLIKKQFSGNINYYEREKAITAFSKYIR